jgi:hypothetical protein
MYFFLEIDQSVAAAPLSRDENESLVRDVMRWTTLEILKALYCLDLGTAVYLDFVNDAGKSNSELAPGVSRAAVSKTCCRLRRGLGLTVRYPNNRRGGTK